MEPWDPSSLAVLGAHGPSTPRASRRPSGQEGSVQQTCRVWGGQGSLPRAGLSNQPRGNHGPEPRTPTTISHGQGLGGQDGSSRGPGPPASTLGRPRSHVGPQWRSGAVSAPRRLQRKRGSPLPERSRGRALFYSPNRKSSASFWPAARGTDFISARTDGQEVSLPNWADGPIRSPRRKPSTGGQASAPGSGRKGRPSGPRAGRTRPAARLGPSTLPSHLPGGLLNTLANVPGQKSP